MTIPDPARRARLSQLGIELWVRRDRPVAAGAQPARDESGLRIRMASGDGDWLLVRRAPWAGEHEALMADITATIGVARCCFGQWVVSDSAGVGPAGLAERGVAHVLSFGPPSRPVSWQGLIEVAPLEQLAEDADARRDLWQKLAPHVTQ